MLQSTATSTNNTFEEVSVGCVMHRYKGYKAKRVSIVVQFYQLNLGHLIHVLYCSCIITWSVNCMITDYSQCFKFISLCEIFRKKICMHGFSIIL